LFRVAAEMPERLRADARANRDQILAAAQALFTERGADVPIKDIADRAGVGVGTLYRRFPDRDSLISAMGHAYLAGLLHALESAERDEDSAWPALARFVGECIRNSLGGLAAALEPGLHARIQRDPRLVDVRTALGEAIVRLIQQAQADGDLRRDVDPQDVALLMTVQIYTRPEQSHADAVARVLAIILDGLRAHH
jgi:AcrR family transcriptional regulator